LRIACGLTQKDLADRLEVTQALVSRDEKNEYGGITQDRYARILRTLGIEEVGVRFTYHQRAKLLHSHLDDRWAMHEAGVDRVA
jgi:transcriptional regulator with XRE-family HTH domain